MPCRTGLAPLAKKLELSVEEARCVSSICDLMSDTGEGEVVRRIGTLVNISRLMISML